MATRAMFAAPMKPLHDHRVQSENDTADLMHAVVPASYAEHVVLDGRCHVRNEVTQCQRRTKHVELLADTSLAIRQRHDDHSGREARGGEYLKLSVGRPCARCRCGLRTQPLARTAERRH
jgi:hypothetical protein